MPTLYIVGTPIGNLEDITLRALRVLCEVKLIAAEDTRTTRKLLNRHNIKTKLTSFHDHNKRGKLPFILEVLKSKDVALVSEAGIPSISDPGADLVREAVKSGVTTVPIPGPSAVTTALSVSGTPANAFIFLGFLPRRKNERLSMLATLSAESRTAVAFEAPRRLRQTLEDMLSAWGDRTIVLCRELTKVHEEIYRGTISGALSRFTQPRGEFTLVVEGVEGTRVKIEENWIESELVRLKAEGLRAKDVVTALAAASGLSRRSVYQKWLDLNKDKSP
mgnify:CR=1 FL=1